MLFGLFKFEVSCQLGKENRRIFEMSLLVPLPRCQQCVFGLSDARSVLSRVMNMKNFFTVSRKPSQNLCLLLLPEEQQVMTDAQSSEYRQRDEDEHDREGICRQTDQAKLRCYGLVHV